MLTDKHLRSFHAKNVWTQQTLVFASSAFCLAVLCTSIYLLNNFQSREAVFVPTDPAFILLRSLNPFSGLDFHRALENGYQAPASQQRGEKICVVMSDNRNFTAFSPKAKLSEVPYYQLSVYHHLLYAIRHGYDFRYVRAVPEEGYHVTWPKITVMLKLLEEGRHDLLVYMDADAYVTDTSLPFSTMFRSAGFKSYHSLMLAQDPFEDANLSSQGVPNLNTGFIVARNTTAAKKTLQAVLACPEQILECEYLKLHWPHEQGALSSYVLPNLPKKTVLSAECNFFNGNPNLSHCTGKYVSHLWFGKGDLNAILIDDMASTLIHAVGASMSAYD